MGACLANGSIEGVVGEPVAALGRTGIVLQLMNGSMKMSLEGGWTSLVIVCVFMYTHGSVVARDSSCQAPSFSTRWKACGHVSIYAPYRLSNPCDQCE